MENPHRLLIIYSKTIDPPEYVMVSASLVRSVDEVLDFYRWLVYRAREEEKNGNDNHARCYQELAAGIEKDYILKFGNKIQPRSSS